MIELGEFEAGKELYLSPRTTLYRAKHKGTGEANGSVLKVYQDPYREEDSPDPLLEEFLAGIQFEKELQTKLPEVSLPCLGAGKQDEMGWVAKPFERFPLERVFEGRIKTEASQIYQLVESLLQVLQQIKSSSGRSHGNLKATNVFLVGEGPLSECKIRLTDFSPLSDPNAKGKMERRDLVSVGRILYKLVTRKDAKSTTVSDLGGWNTFGKKAALWTAFCEDLLKADAEHSSQTFEQVLEQLPGLKPEKPKPWGIVGTVAAILLLGGIVTTHFLTPGGLLSFFQPPPPVSAETREQWETLVSEYTLWGESVNTSLDNALEEGSGTIWHLDPYLFNQVLNFYESNVQSSQVEIDPWEVVDRRVPWQTLDQTVPEILGREKYVIRTEQSLQFTEFLKVRLKSWPTLEELETNAVFFSDRGWEEPAILLRQTRQNYRLDEGLPDYVESVLSNIRLTTQINRFFERASGKIEPLTREGSRALGEDNLQDPVLLSLPELLVDQGRNAESLEGLLERIRETHAGIENLQGYVQSAAYRDDTALELFRRESFLREWDGTLAPTLLIRWLEEIGQYRFLPENSVPLQPSTWGSGFQEAREILEKMDELDELMRRTGTESPLTPAIFGGYEQELADLQALGERAQALPKVLKNRANLESLNNQILQELNAFIGRLRDMLFQLRPDPDEWLRDVNSRTIAGSDALNQFWEARRNGLLEATPRSLWENDDQVFSQLRADLREIQEFLGDLASPSIMPSAAIESRGIPEAIYAAIQEELNEVREANLVRMANQMPDDPDNLEVTRFIEEPEVAAARQDYILLKEQGLEMGRQFVEARQALAAGQGLDGLPGSYFQAWESHPVFVAMQVEESVAEFRGDLVELRDFRQAPIAEPSLLLERIQGGESFPALAIEAYRKLGAVPEWPTSEESWDQDAAAFLQLRNLAEGVAQTNLVSLAQQRWRSRLGEASTPDQLDAIFRQRETYRIEEESLSLSDRYRYFLFRSLEDLRAIPDLRYQEGEAVEQNKQKILRNLSRQDALSAYAEAEDLETELTSFDPTREKPPPPPTELGPALAGWNFVAAGSDQDRYIYEIDDAIFGNQRLEFIRIENPDGGSYWVSDIEISTSIFRMVLDIEGSWPAWEDYNMDRDLATSIDDRSGPRSWEYVGGFMEDPPDGWLFPAPGWDSIGRIYASEEMVSTPTGEHPINYVPAPLAQQFAQFLSCTLPTPEVWERMLDNFPNTNPRNDNIRDETWATQLDYVESAFTSFHPWPDADAFSRALLPEVPTENDAVAVNPGYNDGHLWFNEVRGSLIAREEPLHHLYGNLSEYVFDGRRYFIAGRSALSPPEVAEDTLVPVPDLYELTGFSDVGFRLMFVIDRVSPGIDLLRRIQSRYAGTLPELPTTASL